MVSSDSQQIDLLLSIWETKALQGEETNPEVLCKNHPHLLPELKAKITALKKMNWVGNTSTNRKTIRYNSGDTPLPGIRLEKLIGTGGSGEVWHSTSQELGEIAIKIVPLEKQSAHTELLALEWLSRLQHQHLLRIFKTFEEKDSLFVLMELAQETLYDHFQNLRSQGQQGIPWETLYPWIQQAALALDFLHQPIHGPEKKSFQHRDVKPQNLLLVDGKLKVADFGLARLHAHSLTSHTGALTLGYAAPEFLDGKTHLHSDQYSLACSMIQLLSGHLPFEGTSAQVVQGHLQGKPNLEGVPLSMHSALAKALAKKPKHRWPSCQEFIHHLNQGTRLTFFERRRVLSAMGVFAATATGIAGYKSWFGNSRQHEEPMWPKKLEEPKFLFRLTPQHHLSPAREIAFTLLSDENHGSDVFGFSNGSYGPALWNMAKGKRVHAFGKDYGGACACVAPLEMGLAASGSDLKTITVWNLRTMEKVCDLEGHRSSVNCVRFSPEGSRLVSSACDGRVKVWDHRNQKELFSFETSSRIAFSCVYGTTGEWVAAGGWDGKIAIWNLLNGEKKDLGSHPGKVWRTLCMEDGRTLITSGSDGFIKTWDIQGSRETGSLDLGHEVTGLALVERKILAAGGDSKIHIFRLQDMKKITTMEGPADIECIGLFRVFSDFICMTVGTKANGFYVYGLPMDFEKTIVS